MQAGLLEFANDPYRLLRNGMQEREEALGQRKRFGQMLYAANEDRDFMRAQFARLMGAAPGITELILRLRRTGPARPGRRLMRGRTFRRYRRGGMEVPVEL
jgi:hypothetical protein